MSKRSDAAFAKIAENTVDAAEAVKCSIQEFYEGLDFIRVRILERMTLEKYDKPRPPGAAP